MSDQDLVNISLSQDVNALRQRLNKLSPDLGKVIDTMSTNMVKGTTNLALAGFKSKIPIDTSALRGRGLDDGFLKGVVTSGGKVGKVFIEEGTHVNRHGKKQSSTGLADILNKGSGKNGKPLHRSQDSAAIGVPDSNVSPYGDEKQGSETGDWEGKAWRAFISPAKLGAFLKNTDFIKNG